MTVELACGHTFHDTRPTAATWRTGMWISCWAVMHPQQGCQTQRKVIRVTGQEALW